VGIIDFAKLGTAASVETALMSAFADPGTDTVLLVHGERVVGTAISARLSTKLLREAMAERLMGDGK
jgi:hypothetical protein